MSPQYKDFTINERRHDVENENLLFKEFYTYDQLSLLQHAVYMISIDSDAFVWIGSMVRDLELLDVLYELPTVICNDTNVHFVHEFYEPEIFTLLFSDWKNRTLLQFRRSKDTLDAVQEESDDDADGNSSNSSDQSQSSSKFGVTASR